MNILITDCTSELGEFIKKTLSVQHNIISFTKESLDVSNKVQCYNSIVSIKPDLVIYTNEISNIDLCERNETLAYTINTLGSLNIAYPCYILDIPLVYISSAYVYDGNKLSPYYETDEYNPLNVFGKTKLSGEKLIKTLCKKYFIIRTSWLYGGKDCFIKKIITNKSIPIFVCTEETSNVTYIGDLCNAISSIIETDLFGTYNCVSNDSVSKYLWVKNIFDSLKIDKAVIEMPLSFVSNAAKRPKYSTLSTSLIKNCFNIQLPDWKYSLQNYINSELNK